MYLLRRTDAGGAAHILAGAGAALILQGTPSSVRYRGGSLQVVGQDDRTPGQRLRPGLQRLLLRGRSGRLAFERVWPSPRE